MTRRKPLLRFLPQGARGEHPGPDPDPAVRATDGAQPAWQQERPQAESLRRQSKGPGIDRLATDLLVENSSSVLDILV
jgi:hypothetical protein